MAILCAKITLSLISCFQSEDLIIQIYPSRGWETSPFSLLPKSLLSHRSITGRGFPPVFQLQKGELFPVHCLLSIDQWSTPVCRNTDLKSKMTWFLHLSWPMLTVLPNSSTARKMSIFTNAQILHIFPLIHGTLCAVLAAITILLIDISKLSIYF